MLGPIKTLAHGISYRLEYVVDRFWTKSKKRLGWLDPVTIQPFRGYGDGQRLFARARVLEETGNEKRERRKGRLGTMARMFNRFESDEIAGAEVEARYEGKSARLKSDEEGYVEISLDNLGGSPADEVTWQDATLELIEPYAKDQPRPWRIDLPILTPPASAEFAVVSDIDDTILQTGAVNLLRNLRTTLFSSVEERRSFPGVPPLYRALQRGQGKSMLNPIFYVSSSPWNLYDYLEQFMTLNDIPLGPMFLRDLGIDGSKFIKSGHDTHKLAAIETLMAFYPDLRFILIGDSGQHDAEIYRTAAERHPDQVLAVWIHALKDEHKRNDHANAVMDRIASKGVDAFLYPDLSALAEHAAARGWIAASALDEVKASISGSTSSSGA